MHIHATSDASMVHAPKVPWGPRDAKAARALSRFPESRFIPSTNGMSHVCPRRCFSGI